MNLATKMRCPHCNALPGKLHEEGCVFEQCPYCGLRITQCDCLDSCYQDKIPDEDRIPWSGEWPGTAACREFGWYVVFTKTDGFISCDPDAPGASEDLNRLYREAVWDPVQRRWLSNYEQEPPHLPDTATGRLFHRGRWRTTTQYCWDICTPDFQIFITESGLNNSAVQKIWEWQVIGSGDMKGIGIEMSLAEAMNTAVRRVLKTLKCSLKQLQAYLQTFSDMEAFARIGES